MKIYYALILSFILSFCTSLESLTQTPFICSEQVYLLEASTHQVSSLSINASNNAIENNAIISNFSDQINVLAFRSSDRLLYGIDSVTHILYRMDAVGKVEPLVI